MVRSKPTGRSPVSVFMAISAPAPGILPSRQPSPAPLPIRIWRDGVHWMGSLRCRRRCRCRVALPWSGAACHQRSAVNVNGTRLERQTSMSRGCPIAHRRHCASCILHLEYPSASPGSAEMYCGSCRWSSECHGQARLYWHRHRHSQPQPQPHLHPICASLRRGTTLAFELW